MHRIVPLALAAVTAAALTACSGASGGQQGAGEAGCATSFDANADYFPDKVAARQSALWQVEYRKNYKVLRVNSAPSAMAGMGSMGGAAPAEQKFVLYQCGTPQPELTGDLAGASAVRVPIKAAAVGEPAIPAAFEVLAPDKLVAYDEQSLDATVARTMPKVAQRLTDKRAQPIGHGAQLNTERLIELHPDVFFAAATDQAKADQLKQAGIPVLSYTAFNESPRGAAEQIKLLSLFTGQEKQANDYADGVLARYDALSAKATGQSAKPGVLIGSNDHGAEFTARQRDYFDAALVRDAGTRNVLDLPGRSMQQVPMERVVEAAGGADFWFQMNFVKNGLTAQQLVEQVPATSRIPALAAGRAYARAQPKEYSSWGLLNPDLLLADVVGLTHPELLPGHQPAFFRQIQP
ncbi:ABC transporter substrate-binding protein [Amycolatopsis anabasis]|uniref:ABC transporter substrate-binding protein n=1 Tax=Amycolatopsis anabasis TaxID=1840409 RepID=UPI00131BCE24|nr:ABC transporter substrate-binding protein [Amycolatopsis anabasis]